MDIDLLSKMVKELILDNDKVVLPGLGCFVAEIVPSTFSDKGYTINPPYRKLSFRAKPDSGDELAAFYASQNGVAKDIADMIMTDFVAELKSVLLQKKTVVFPALGRLRATKENTVFFVADENLDIYPAGFGLVPVSLKTHQETEEEVSAAVEGLRSLLDDAVQDSSAEETVSSAPSAISSGMSAVSPSSSGPSSTAASDAAEDAASVLSETSLSEPSSSAAVASIAGTPAVSSDEAAEVSSSAAVAAEKEETTVSAEPSASAATPEPSASDVTTSDATTTETTPTEATIIQATVAEATATEESVKAETETAAAVQECDADTGKGKKNGWKTALWIISGILLAVVLLAAAYMAVAIYAPQWLDGILYSQEELDILNYKR